MAQLNDLLVAGASRLLNGLGVLGNANMDSIFPNITDTYSLGSSDKRWNLLYAKTLNTYQETIDILTVNTKATIGNGAGSTSATTGSLIVKGGIGVNANSYFGGTITSSKFIGPLQGNADSATTLQTPRTFTIGNTGKSFNGSANLNWTVAEIGAVPHKKYTTASLDFNTLTTTAWNSVKNTSTNSPTTSSHGTMLSDFDIGTPFQIWYPDMSMAMYKRWYTNGAWTAWSNTWAINITGSASQWATARTLTIGNTGKSVNGTGNVSWSLAEIGAATTNHTHGLLHSNFNKQIDNTTTDSGWSMINSSYNGFMLMSLRTQANAPAWIQNNFAAGVAFGGADTKGVFSVAYNAPLITIAGGNGSKPTWYIKFSGTSAKTYNLDSMLTTANYSTTLNPIYVNVSGDTMTGALNFANNVWNKLGDDVQFGDNNTAGAFCIQGLNGTTALKMTQYGGTNVGTISFDGSKFIASHYLSANVTFSDVTGILDSYDTRAETRTPQNTPRGLTVNFKQNSTYELSDGGTYIGLLSWRSYSSGSDLSGGQPIEIAYTQNGNLWTRMGTSATAWGGWNRIIKHSFLQERGLYKDYGYQTSSSIWPSMLAVNQFFSFTNWWDSGTYMPYIYGSGIMIPHLDANYRSFLYCQCSAAKVWVGFVNKSSTTSPTWRYLWAQGDSVTGAVWNDYAECRESDTEDLGYVLMETGKDSLTKTTERLSHFAGISSDTWGFSQGETEKAKTPIAVAGRVLVYTYQNRNNYKPGDCVCAAPGGTVDIMTREEVILWPDRIVGTVSQVPDYDEWGGGDIADRSPVKVNGRIWIKVK